jgi:uncharacterized membrane protein
MTGSFSALVLAACAFVGVHLLPSTPLRGGLIKLLGGNGYLAMFSVAAGAALIWYAAAYSAAPHRELWPALPALRYVPLVAMPFAMVLLVCGYTTRNPMAVMQEKHFHATDPAPGILKVTRHPIMWAIALWALSHAAANGDQASLIFFGGLTALALLGMPLMDHRRAETLGSAWGPFALTTSAIPFVAAIQGRAKPRLSEIGWWRIALGLALYAGALAAHGPPLGPSALP